MATTTTTGGPEDMTLGADAVTIVEGHDSQREDQILGVGAQIGRYVVVEALGEGGMGRVVRAYDAKLRREVALKMLRSSSDEEGRIRILREAQAMAQLTHPNVVAVYDVETYEGRPFIAMEYVEGTTLRTWAAAEKRSWREILDVFRAAGRGLSAAHRAGLVHRDFKPANVLILDDGSDMSHRVRVTDFGLARGVEHLSSNSPAAPIESGGDTLTIAGTVMGTPAYMAPEQHAGRGVDARSDQYAFCVALWEALAGTRPFVGPGLAKRKLHPEQLGFDTLRDAPRFVRRVLRRGLSVDPVERYPSMDVLLENLARTPARTRNRIAFGAAGVGLVGWVAGSQISDSAKRADCEDLGRSIATVYGDATREVIRARFLATGSPLAEQTLQRLTPRLQQYADQWSKLRTEACVSAELEGGDRSTYQLATGCFDERRAELEGAVEAFRNAEAATVAYAVATVAELSSPGQCNDPKWLHTTVLLPDDDETRAAVLSARKKLAGVQSHVRAGRYAEAEAAVPAVAGDEAALRFGPLLARVRMLEGDLADLQRDVERARTLYEEAFYAAGKAGADETAAEVALALAFVSPYGEHGTQLGLMWADLAEMLLERSGGLETLAGARLHHGRAVVQERMGLFEEALAGYERSIALRRRLSGDDDLGISASYNNIANIQRDQRDLQAARENYERAIEIRERMLGSSHPKSALPLRNVGQLEYEARAYEDALMYLEDARDIHVDVWGEEHLFVSGMLTRIGRIYYARGQYAAALDHHERALAIMESQLEPDHAEIASGLDNVGQTYERLGLPEEALPLYERALQILEANDRKHALAFTTMLIGRNLLIRGQPGPALVKLEEALAMARANEASPESLASIQAELARALWHDPDRRHEALAVAQEAIDNYERGGPWNDIWKAEVQAWLDQHR